MKSLLITISIILVALPLWAGQSDTSYCIDYIASFHTRVMSYTPKLWLLDHDSSEVRQALSDACMEVAKIFPGATESVDTIVTDDTLRWYGLASDFCSIVRVAMADPDANGEIGLDSISMADIGKNTSTGDDHPKFFNIFARRIYFDANNSSGDTMFIYYNAYSTELSGDSTLSNVSKEYSNIVVDLGIVFFYGGRVGDAAPAVIALAEKRLDREYAGHGIKYIPITPEVR